MKFQNIRIHGSKVMLCTRKRDKRMNKQTVTQEAICLPTFFKVGDIKIVNFFVMASLFDSLQYSLSIITEN